MQKFTEIVSKKKIDVETVKSGNRVKIEKDLYLDILWPGNLDVINENSINNNALVFKLNYKMFSMLFTGDIEKEAENYIISKYKNTNILKSIILKVGHHGSKSSTTQDFLKCVEPKIALIGVGKNNIYGHPSSEILERLEKMRDNYF